MTTTERTASQSRTFSLAQSDFPLAPLASGQADVLALIVDTEGPSYRPKGAGMAITPEGRRTGSLSSGCIEEDVVLHAASIRASGTPRVIRYGRGSPYPDLALPCGGGLDILLMPVSTPEARAPFIAAQAQLAARRPAALRLPLPDASGEVALTLTPDLRFLVFGKGPEARIFAGLTHLAGYPTELFSPSEETIGKAEGHPARHLVSARWPEGLQTDPYTAVTLFFHDHDWEPPILTHALASDAFYIGAQGSLRTHEARCATLADAGVPPEQIARMDRPFGLIPSARDARTLAVSVLADVLAEARIT
ncbi:XdhC family protein [Thioclava sp. GXIMD2076]|uniref:XdhC family protein n=1 Tax=Thioclava sp. GXIMD2076 TaxID=3131931 RepID=UPI0030D21428